ncbi:MAG TPA: VRR-NUC domain-containing protein [Pseudoxanthomonas sp.]
MSTGTSAMHRVMLAIGRLPWVRVFRNNVAQAWVGDARRLPNGDVLIRNARPLHAGLVKGSSDLIGWTSRVIQPEDVGARVAIFTAIECKDGTGRADKDQRRFLGAVEAAGGIAGVARSENDAVNLVSRE